jgi:hypothetical protein
MRKELCPQNSSIRALGYILSDHRRCEKKKNTNPTHIREFIEKYNRNLKTC